MEFELVGVITFGTALALGLPEVNSFEVETSLNSRSFAAAAAACET
jgi:hypothetical protein